MTAAARRPLVNMAIVLDKSGSMQGEKIAQARQAAEMALERLGPEDIVSIVLYDTAVQTLVPATKLADRETIYAKIRGIQAGGNTALFAGVSKGAAEARKFFSRDRVNRIVLLSDGLANVGPDSPAELGRLGVALAEEGIVVSTIGFGLDYNEDLMAELALRSDGHHYFAENGVDLARAFDVEFGEAVSVVAQNVTIEIECAEGMRPVRVLGRPAEIAGRRVVVQMSQLFGERERYAILELETPAAPPEAARPVAAVRVSYDNMATEQADTIAKRVSARFSADRAEADQALDKRVMADVVEQIAVENNRKAMALRLRTEPPEFVAELMMPRMVRQE